MQLIYTNQEAPESYNKSIFLVGPTPRNQNTKSWRPDMVACLKDAGYDGVVFMPEPYDGVFRCTYDQQVEWEKRNLLLADLVVAWVPRDLQEMPAFTTNVEFGTFIDSGKLIYGRPDESQKNQYLDWLYKDRKLGQIYNDMNSLSQAVVERLGEGSFRSGGERHVPYHVWKMQAFQTWYKSLLTSGNYLVDAKVLWTFNVRDKPFCFALWAKIWITSEGRYKENEFVLSRSDISTVFAFWHDQKDFLNSKVLLVKEFRGPGHTKDGYIHELPGGSSFTPNEDPFIVAVHELEEETGISVEIKNIKALTGRQLAGTFSSHKAELFAVKLSDEELSKAVEFSRSSKVFGVAEDTERTYLEVRTLKDLLSSQDVDWSTLGMIFQGISAYI